MGRNTSELINVLDQIAALLPSDAEQHWSAYIDECRRLLLACDYSGIEKLLSLNGDMGSFEAELKELRDVFQHESWADLRNTLGGST